MDGVEDLVDLVADGLRVERVGRLFHPEKTEQNQEVVRDHVAQGAGRVVVGAAMLHADGLGDRDLDMIDVLTIPERLDETVGKPKDHDVLNRLLAHLVRSPAAPKMIMAFGGAGGVVSALKRCVCKGSLLLFFTLNRAGPNACQVCRGRPHPNTWHTPPGAV